MGLRMKNFNIMEVPWKIRFLWEEKIYGSRKTNIIYRRDCLKRGLGQFPDLRGGLAKKREVVFLRGRVDNQIHTTAFSSAIMEKNQPLLTKKTNGGKKR